MNYSEFKTYLQDFLWKPSDAKLIANLDNLIRMANAELDRIFKVEDRHASAQLALDANDVALPSDYHSIISVESDDSSVHIRDFAYVEPEEIVSIRRRSDNTGWAPYYSIKHKTLLFSGPFATAPTTAVVHYYAKVPDFATNDASWVEQDYLDIYTYAVLKQAGAFLREDERVPLWESNLGTSVAQAVDDSEFNKIRPQMAYQQLPRNPSATRRRR